MTGKEKIFDEQPMRTLDSSIWLLTGEQYCPECHVKIIQKNDYWECSECNWSISNEEVDAGYGYPTKEASYENDYETYYDEDSPHGDLLWENL